jgi:deoxycytidylate deaminase
MKKIDYPYLPPGKTIKYVLETNEYMVLAKSFAKEYSLDYLIPGSAVVVKNGNVIGIGANGSDFHKKYGCERVRLGCETGKGYELCPGCSQENHSEIRAIDSAIKNSKKGILDVDGADLYLWGHWWFCEYCWNRMIQVGIKDAHLMYESDVLFNKKHPSNILGRQFTK